MSSLATVYIPDLTDVRYGSTSVKRIMHGSRLLWSSGMLPFIRYDSQTGQYYNVIGISADNTQYIETALEPYYLVDMTGLYDFPLGVYASIDTVVEMWFTRLQDNNDCTISNAWSMNDSTGSWRVFAYNNQNALCFDFGSKSSSWSSSSSKGPERYMQRLYYYSREPLDGTGDIFHMIVGRIDNKAAQIIYKGDTQVCNNSGTLTSFYRGTDAEAQLHLYHYRNNNDTFKFYKVVVRQNNLVVRNIYWKKDANDNLYLYDAVTESVIQPTRTDGSLTYQTGQDTYTLHDDIGPVKEYYYQDGYVTVNDVKYEKLVSNLDNTKIIQGKIVTESSYILYQNNKYYKVIDIVNNQYVKEELEPYYHGEVINSIVDWPLGVQATIDTMVEVWCTQMLSNNTIFLGTVYNDNTNGTFKLYTNGSYNTANSLIFKFASSNVNTSSDTISNNYDSYSYSCGSHSNANSLIGGSGAEKPIYYIKAGNIGGHTGLVVEHSSQYNYSNINSNPIVSFYQGTFELSELHMKFTSTSSQVKLFKLRIWHGNEVVKDLRWRFRNNIKTDANMYLWDDVTQSEMIPSNPNVKIQYYSSQGQSTHIGTSDKYILSHDDRFSDYYTVNGTITENGVIYERLVNSIDSTDVKKGIQVGTVPDTPDTPVTLAEPEVEWLLPDYDLLMTCSTPGASIYWSVSGESPEDATYTEPVLYTEPVNWSVLYDLDEQYSLASEGFVKVQSYLNGQWSEVVKFDFYAS